MMMMICFSHTDGIYVVFPDNGILSSADAPSASIFHMAAEVEADTELTEWLKQQGVDSHTVHKVTLCCRDSGIYALIPHQTTYHPLIFSSTHSLIHSTCHLLVHLSPHLLIHSFIHLFIFSSYHWLTHPLSHSSLHSLILSFTHPLIFSFSHPLLWRLSAERVHYSAVYFLSLYCYFLHVSVNSPALLVLT